MQEVYRPHMLSLVAVIGPPGPRKVFRRRFKPSDGPIGLHAETLGVHGGSNGPRISCLAVGSRTWCSRQAVNSSSDRHRPNGVASANGDSGPP